MNYPKEMFVKKTSASVFYVLDELTLPTNEGEPMLLHDSSFSRFSFNIVKAKTETEKGKGVNANINVSEIPRIVEILDMCLKERLRNEYYPAKPQNSSSNGLDSKMEDFVKRANKKLTMGKLKGKSPAEILLNEPNGEQILQNQYDFLKQSAEKDSRYAKNNHAQMDAIGAALFLKKKGSLADETIETKNIVLYDSGVRALHRRKRDDGYCFVYQIKMEWIDGMDNPLSINIKNYYANVIQTEQGLINVKEIDKNSCSDFNVSLTEKESINLKDALVSHKNCFEICNYTKQAKLAEKLICDQKTT